MSRTLVLALLVLAPFPAARAQERASTSPHGTLPANLACTACHTVDGWRPLLQAFDHDTNTAFPLAGSHRRVACTACHLGGRFDEPKAGPADCRLCHVDVHSGSLSPNCSECHRTTQFNDVARDEIHQRTAFALTGAHRQVTCDACHPGDDRGVFVTRDIACISCHRADYESASPIDHVATGFSTECEQCHNTVAFAFAVRFDHVAASGGFPLEGRHVEIRCESCHDPATLQPIYPTNDPNDCYTCHADDYTREHGTAFPTTCTDCHTVMGWEGAQFDHAAVAPQFPLESPHDVLPCDRCHRTSDWSLLVPATTPDNCYACHADDYQQEHGGSGFPTDCLACHQQGTWDGASFAQHDGLAFPIYSGAHRDRWSSCSDCHTVAGDFNRFECITCHEHDRTRMDDKHKEEAGYVYDSAACYSCHPSGRSD